MTRPRTLVTPEQIIEALEASGGDVERAAVYLSQHLGVSVSGRTVYRRIRDFGIKPSVRFTHGEAA